MKLNDRTGEVNYNKYGRKMIIEQYRKYIDITVIFTDNDFRVTTSYQAFKNQQVSNPFDKTVHGVGYLGIGKYKAFAEDEFTPEYLCWKKMMRRGYDIPYIERYPTYKSVTVCEEWHNFQNFAKWYDENHYTIAEEIIHLDKDILIKGNKIYSPNTCVFVPERINALFLKSDATRGEYPIGVCFNKHVGKYSSLCNDGVKQRHLGYFNTPIAAFDCYKIYKENLIKEVANKYKNYIPENLYDALLKYEVEITD